MIYIAAPFFNEEQIRIVKQIETLFECEKLKYFSPRKHTVTLKNLTPEEREKAAPDVFESNIYGLDRSNFVIACTDDKDIGTAWEMGYKFRQYKSLKMNNVVTFSPKGKHSNVMLSQCSGGHLVYMSDLVRFIEFIKTFPRIFLLKRGIFTTGKWDDLINKFDFKVNTMGSDT